MQTRIVTLKVAVTEPDAVDFPKEHEEAMTFLRAVKQGTWPNTLPPCAKIESAEVGKPINRRVKPEAAAA